MIIVIVLREIIVILSVNWIIYYYTAVIHSSDYYTLHLYMCDFINNYVFIIVHYMVLVCMYVYCIEIELNCV